MNISDLKNCTEHFAGSAAVGGAVMASLITGFSGGGIGVAVAATAVTAAASTLALTVADDFTLPESFSSVAGVTAGALSIFLATPAAAVSTAEVNLEETTPATTLIIDGQQDIQTFMGASDDFNTATLDDGTVLTLPSPEALPALDSAPAPR